MAECRGYSSPRHLGRDGLKYRHALSDAGF
ncbi:Uncharacterised protein [Vibrio cholerae]|nr:Uncharacterised protein [Vibrio cholerae]